jgi:hypothetical protein
VSHEGGGVGLIVTLEGHAGADEVGHAVDTKRAPVGPGQVERDEVPLPRRVHEAERLDVPVGAVALAVEVREPEALGPPAGNRDHDERIQVGGRELGVTQADGDRTQGGDPLSELNG